MKESPASYANDPPLSLRHLWEHYTPSSSLTWQTSVVESLSPTDHRRSRSLTSTISASTRSSRSMSPVTSLSSAQASPVPHLGLSPSLMEPSPAYHVSSRTTAAAPRRGGRPPPIMNAYQSTTPSMLESSAMAPLGFASSRGSVRPAPSHYATQQIGSPISHSTQSYETLAQNPLMIITDAQGGSHEAHEFMAGWSSLMPPDPFDPHGWSPSLLSPESPYAASILSTTSSFEDGSPYWGDQSLPSPNYYSQDTSTDLTPVSGASEPRGTSYGSNTQATTTVQQPHGWYTHPPFPR
ncbi:hypothetical protein DL93DRAFT_403384 [Clavulina sp. PMI_390]|nr:hypothetical protein DL93DRAFT_403384 [Clavulina sp. PMI_390]